MSRDEWVEAGAQAIDGEEATCTTGYYGGSHRVDAQHAPDLAALVVAAVEPLIRADEREALARWKAEATEVLSQWEQVWEVLGSPGRLGASKAAATLAAVNSWGYILRAADVANAARRELRADLRQRVEEMHAESMASPTGCPGPTGTAPCCDLGVVLALFDGGGDE